ncbi:hypothetical protein DO97_13650 [Neosynechococcus sphagnicola sy1]|uniref:Permease n=1 Tax=Neosynechococcus sphagnicola sy1 TaxID=1497020 RepID=A0A098TIU1_9CYAN|nr:AEC family transporter [Neosynechococcus sphagnicola]KGF71956.1 hypothetical protein DO97_13650 [Neosynechococcus sphagnicola sy1]
MTHAVVPKAIALILLIGVGYLLQKKFQDPTAIGAIRNFILNAALPATIFLSTIEIDTTLDLVLLPSFALAVNLFLFVIGSLVSALLIKQSESDRSRALILLFPSLAPGLTVYPFIAQFSGQQGLAWAALADMGNKFFVLVGLYAFAIFWYQQSQAQTQQTKIDAQWLSIVRFLISEPVNIAIVLAVILAIFNINSQRLPLALSDAIQKLAVCATPMILFYVGISLNLKSFQFGKLLMILLARSGAGFMLSAVAIALLNPTTPDIRTLFVALPQASCSLWPLLHATNINQLPLDLSADGDREPPVNFFNIEFATALLAMSFPFSIFILLIVFSSGNYFTTPDHLSQMGMILLLAFGSLLLMTSLLRSHNLLQISPWVKKISGGDQRPLGHCPIAFQHPLI